ncbi:ABC transporter ATP-binding protein [Rhodomicrobium vannielii]|uniref:ABC transporter ATP-binding protein n=1 Tax=Rhodomicrobium vannielii TaxID=1069 RepID=UPI0031B9E90E
MSEVIASPLPSTEDKPRRHEGGADIVRIGGVQFTWPGRNPFTLAIDGFSLAKCERLLLIGPSGSGKSTFLSLLAGIAKPDAGKIDVLGCDIARLDGAARDRFRAEHYGIIFQMFNLLPYASVIDNVLLPLSFSPSRKKRAEARGGGRTEAARLLANLGIEPSLIESGNAASLSVGQQQRVAAARALIGSPEIIIADEPTSSLDRNRQQAFLDLLFAEVEAAGATLIMVSHDESLAGRFSRVADLAEIAQASRGGRS